MLGCLYAQIKTWTNGVNQAKQYPSNNIYPKFLHLTMSGFLKYMTFIRLHKSLISQGTVSLMISFFVQTTCSKEFILSV